MDRAIDTVLARQEMLTAHLAGKLRTSAFVDAVAAEVER